MLRALKRFLAWLVPAYPDPETTRDARLTMTFGLVIIGIGSVVLSRIFLSDAYPPWAKQLGGGLFAAYFIMLAVARSLRRPALMANVIVGQSIVSMLVITVARGGVHSQAANWFPVLLIAAGLICSRRALYAWCAALIVGTQVIFRTTAMTPWPFEHSTPREYALAVSLTCVLATALIVLFKAARERAFRAVRGRNRDMAILLGNVDQGLLVIRPDGSLVPERSSALDAWIGAPKPGSTAWAYFAPHDAIFAQWLEIGWHMLGQGMLPLELILDQLPTRMQIGERHYAAAYKTLEDDGRLEAILLILTDTTAELERAKGEQEQREALALFERFVADRAATVPFLRELPARVDALDRDLDTVTLKRLLHTLKGDAGMYGLERVVAICHEFESAIEDVHGDDLAEISRPHFEGLARHASSLAKRVMNWHDGRDEAAGVWIRSSDYDALMRAADRNSTEVGDLLRRTQQTPVRESLERAAQHTASLCKRLRRDGIEIAIDADPKLRLDDARWSAFWSAHGHLVRNSVTHAFEEGAVDGGRIELAARRVNGEFTITVSDNGRGVDWDEVKSRAAALALPHDTPDDLVEALFHDGLSTAEDVSVDAGRGVGLSAVRSEVEARGGRIDVASDGGWTRFVMHFPVAQLTPAG